MSISIFEVGGSIRDICLGVESKDRDFCVVGTYDEMEQYILDIGGDIKLPVPQHMTIRFLLKGRPFDFAVCRKEGDYLDARHPQWVEPCSLEDDLLRRDFTINAMAMKVELINGELIRVGEIIDLFNGREDLKNKTLRCVGEARLRMTEDPIRVLRAIRFAITKNLRVEDEIHNAFNCWKWGEQLPEKFAQSVSEDRVRNELNTCFRHNPFETMRWLSSVLHPKWQAILLPTNGANWIQVVSVKK